MATAKEIEQEFIAYINDKDGLNVKHFDDIWSEYVNERLATKEQIEKYSYYTDIILPSGHVYLVDKYGGEGKGEEYWVVLSVGEQLFRVDGFYASWDGVTWEDPHLHEVEPVEVIKIEYVQVASND